MNLHAKYDMKEDRVRFTLHLANDVNHILWITRRQWLGLLHSVSLLLPNTTEAVVSNPRKQSAPKPIEAALPVLVQGIRLKRLTNGVRIIFQKDTQNIAITLGDIGLRQLRDMLLQQSEYIDWDVMAAMTRLKAQNLAQQAMRKAGRKD